MFKNFKYCYGSCMRPDGTHIWYLIDPDAKLKSSYDFYLSSNDPNFLKKLSG